MKSILLTTTAIVAFAGAAFADGHTGVSFSGNATLGYNDNDTLVDDTLLPGDDGFGDTVGENGFYWDAEMGVNMTAALDNGVTAAADLTLLFVEDDLGGDVAVDGNYVLSLSTESAALRFGDLDPVAEDNWGGVDGASVADFNDQDTHFDTAGFDAMLVGEVTIADVTAMLSYGVALDDGNDLTDEQVDALQLYVSGAFGMFTAEFAYQDEFGPTPQIFGISATATVAGAEVTGAYIDDETESSFGLAVAYPVGPVTLGGYYSVNDIAEDSYGASADYSDGPIAVNAFYDFTGNTGSADEETEIGVEGSYEALANLTLLAGYISTEVGAADSTAQTYVAGVYDLGGGAELLVSYAEDDNELNDEIGDPEYLPGTTVEVSFSF